MQLPSVKTDIQVRYSDIDAYEHVSNSIYLQYFDSGRLDFFSEIERIEGMPTFVVASIHIDYLIEVSPNDTVWVETWCESIGKKSLRVNQNVYANGECAAKGIVTLVGFDKVKREAKNWPEHWRPSVGFSEANKLAED